MSLEHEDAPELKPMRMTLIRWVDSSNVVTPAMYVVPSEDKEYFFKVYGRNSWTEAGEVIYLPNIKEHYEVFKGAYPDGVQ